MPPRLSHLAIVARSQWRAMFERHFSSRARLLEGAVFLSFYATLADFLADRGVFGSSHTGLSDRVDFHTWSLLKGVVLSTLLGVGAELQFSGETHHAREASVLWRWPAIS